MPSPWPYGTTSQVASMTAGARPQTVFLSLSARTATLTSSQPFSPISLRDPCKSPRYSLKLSSSNGLKSIYPYSVLYSQFMRHLSRRTLAHSLGTRGAIPVRRLRDLRSGICTGHEHGGCGHRGESSQSHRWLIASCESSLNHPLDADALASWRGDDKQASRSPLSSRRTARPILAP